jgi:hypothetical protein
VYSRYCATTAREANIPETFLGNGSVKESMCEAEEPPLFEAVAREGLVKPQQAGKGLAGAVVISELWRLTVAL